MTDPANLRLVAGGPDRPGLDLPETLGQAEWRKIGAGLARAQRAAGIEWRLGDWAARADGAFATLPDAAAIVGESAGNLRKYVAAAKAYPPIRRRIGLAFFMHLEAAALPEDARERLLDCAEAEHWTRDTMWLATGVTDMRRGMNTLALQVQQDLGRDPHAGDLYVFRRRAR